MGSNSSGGVRFLHFYFLFLVPFGIYFFRNVLKSEKPENPIAAKSEE